VLIGARTCSEEHAGERARSCGEAAAINLASPGATTAEVAAVQVPRLRDLAPAQVVLQLGSQDLVDGYDESYFHARVVELCDAIMRAAPRAEVAVVAMPQATVPPHLERLRRRCNAAARVTAEIRGLRWSAEPPAEQHELGAGE
jgi:lysophospholipase L1-like esterase